MASKRTSSITKPRSAVMLAHYMNRHIRRVGSGAPVAAGASAKPTYLQRKWIGIILTMGIITTGMLVLAGIKSNGVGNFGIDGANGIKEISGNNFDIPNPAHDPNPVDHNNYNNRHLDDHDYDHIPNPNVVERTEELTRQNGSRHTYHLRPDARTYYHGSRKRGLSLSFIPSPAGRLHILSWEQAGSGPVEHFTLRSLLTDLVQFVSKRSHMLYPRRAVQAAGGIVNPDAITAAVSLKGDPTHSLIPGNIYSQGGQGIHGSRRADPLRGQTTPRRGQAQERKSADPSLAPGRR